MNGVRLHVMGPVGEIKAIKTDSALEACRGGEEGGGRIFPLLM